MASGSRTRWFDIGTNCCKTGDPEGFQVGLKFSNVVSPRKRGLERREKGKFEKIVSRNSSDEESLGNPIDPGCRYHKTCCRLAANHANFERPRNAVLLVGNAYIITYHFVVQFTRFDASRTGRISSKRN